MTRRRVFRVEGFPGLREALAELEDFTRLGGEPQAAAIMLGKALNDPIKGITALSRVGVQLTDDQKDLIRTMSQTGNIAGAQGVRPPSAAANSSRSALPSGT